MAIEINEIGIILFGKMCPWDNIEVVGKQHKQRWDDWISSRGQWSEYYIQVRGDTNRQEVVSTATIDLFVPLEVYRKIEKLLRYARMHPHIKFEERYVFKKPKEWDVNAELKALAYYQSDKVKKIRDDAERQTPQIFLTIGGLTLLTVAIIVALYFMVKNGVIPNFFK